MKLTVLIDNNTLIDRYFYGEPGVSYLIEEENIKLLFDVGYSAAFIQNANKLNKSLMDINYIVISHGHQDHTWGLDPLIRLYGEAGAENITHFKPTMIAHPLAFAPKDHPELGEIGSIITLDKLSKHFKVQLTKEPLWLNENLVFLGEIARTNDFENKSPIGTIEWQGRRLDDYLLDDSALAYKTEEGLIIITGCSHSGICNIVEYAKKVCGDQRVLEIIGGFHLLNPPEALLKKTVDYLKQIGVKSLYACHCTDLRSKIELAQVANLKEVGVGLVLEY